MDFNRGRESVGLIAANDRSSMAMSASAAAIRSATHRPSAGTPGKYYFVGWLRHEITEVMGRIRSLATGSLGPRATASWTCSVIRRRASVI